MATITTDTFLDDGTARTAGEQWTINGCVLTVRTDTRWYANAPAGMTGCLGTTILSQALGGQFYINAQNIRWMKYDSGSGNVPAIGTTITQGGVSGYLLGVWQDYVSAPTAVGAAMPATGYLKFRETVGGTYVVGALTGIGANATSPDVLGWIEVVYANSATAWSTSPLDQGFKTRGGWFYLDDTTGVRGQTIQVPTNGGGANTHIQGVQIETAPGSGIYEWWAGYTVANGFTATNFPTTGIACKFFLTAGNGVIRIGSDGTTNIAMLPPSGCKVRIPNIFLRYSGPTAVSTNVAPVLNNAGGTSFSNGGTIDLEYVAADCNIIWSCTNPTVINFKNSYTPNVGITSNQSVCTFDNCLIGGYISGTTVPVFNVNSTVNQVNLTNSRIINANAGAGNPATATVYLNIVDNFTCSNTEILSYKIRTTSSPNIIGMTLCNNATFTNIKMKNGTVYTTYSNYITLTSIDYTDALAAITSAANGNTIFNFTTCNNILVDGLTFGENNTYTGVQPYASLITASGTNVILRNAGTRLAPLNCGASPTFYPNSIGTTSVSGKIQRVYLTGVRTGLFGIFSGLTKKTTIEHVYATDRMNLTSGLFGVDCIVRNNGCTYSNSALGSLPGQNVTDYFTTDTTGFIVFAFNQPDSFNSQYCTTSWAPAKGTGWRGDGGLSMDTVGDYTIIECPYSILGHTGFQNVTMGYSGFNSDTDYLMWYQLNKGAGYPGTWTALSAANLSAEAGLNPSGFKMKIKVQWNNAANVNGTGYIYNIRIPTTSTLTAQANNLYPLSTATLSFTGLATGSEVRCYTGTDPSTAVEIGGIESTAGSTFSFTHSSGGVAGYITILAMGYQPVRFNYTYKSTDDSILIQPVVDRNYVNPP